jgi:hypothetical protein
MTTYFTGPVKAGVGASEGAASVTAGGPVVLSQTFTIDNTGVAPAATVDQIVYLPALAEITSIRAVTTVAQGSTTYTIQAGSTAGGVDYVAAVTCKAQGVVNATLLFGAATIGAGSGGITPVYFRFAAGTPAANGVTKVTIQYIQAV